MSLAAKHSKGIAQRIGLGSGRSSPAFKVVCAVDDPFQPDQITLLTKPMMTVARILPAARSRGILLGVRLP